MRPYSCYPPARTRFQPNTTRFNNPNFPPFRNAGFKNQMISTSPSANIVRKEGSFDIQLAIPGLSKEQVKIEIHENQLTIHATAKESNPRMIRKEFNYEGFKRSFRLHKNADMNAINASFDQGILTINIPDLEKTITKINIQ